MTVKKSDVPLYSSFIPANIAIVCANLVQVCTYRRLDTQLLLAYKTVVTAEVNNCAVLRTQLGAQGAYLKVLIFSMCHMSPSRPNPQSLLQAEATDLVFFTQGIESHAFRSGDSSSIQNGNR